MIWKQRQTHTEGRQPYGDEAEITAMQLKAVKSQGLPATSRGYEARGRFSPRVFRERAWFPCHIDVRLLASRTKERRNFHSIRPPSLW